MPFTIESAIKIDGPHLQRSVYLPVTIVEQESYLTIHKNDRRLERLFGNRDPKARLLSKTTIIEDLVHASSQVFWEKLGQGVKRRLSQVDLHKVITMEGSKATISMPAIGPLPVTTFNILITRPVSHTVTIAATSEFLEYIYQAIAYQSENNELHRKRAADDDQSFSNEGIIGISKDYKRNQVRCTFFDSEKGKVKQRVFPIVDSDESIAMDRAKEFMRHDGQCDDGNDGSDNNDDTVQSDIVQSGIEQSGIGVDDMLACVDVGQSEIDDTAVKSDIGGGGDVDNQYI